MDYYLQDSHSFSLLPKFFLWNRNFRGDAPADNSNTTTTKNSSTGALGTRMGGQSIICVLTAVLLAVATL
jgi:hypothetical protein